MAVFSSQRFLTLAFIRALATGIRSTDQRPHETIAAKGVGAPKDEQPHDDTEQRARGSQKPDQEDHHLACRQSQCSPQGLRVLLEKQTDLEIVGETSNGQETLREVDRLKPAVLIVDLAMPQLSGLEISREITRHQQQTRVLLLSAHANQQSVVDGFKNGASGYLLKSSTIDELIDAIRRIHPGSRYLPPAYSEADIDNFIETIKNSENNGSALLTRRERQILQLVAEG